MGSQFGKEIPDEAKDAFWTHYRKNQKSWMLSLLLAGGGLSYFIHAKTIGHSEKKQKEYIQKYKQQKSKRRKKIRTAVNRQFITDLKVLLNIAIPSLWSKEVLYMLILAFFLVVRTILSIRIADVNGTIVKAIVRRKFWRFVMRIATLGSIAIPASFVNSWLSYYTNRLALQYRTRLVHDFHDSYCSEMMYYKVSNIDSRIENADQAMTETLTLWGRSLSELYTNLTKPLLDIVLFSNKLAELMGWGGPGMVMAYYAISMFLIRIISPPFGTLAAITQNLEGNFRSSHHRIIAHSEEIAFYGGHNKEKEILNDQYKELEQHRKYVLGQQFGMKAFNGFLQKYGSVMCGYTVLGLPVFGRNSGEYLRNAKNSSDITQDYIRNSSLLINLSKAIGRIVTSYEDIQRLAGYTKLVSNIKKVLADLETGNYEREMVISKNDMEEKQLCPNTGSHISCEDYIKFDGVSVITPNGDILVNEIEFIISTGENLMIVGPNGCGKSSLFRMLGKLWPLWNGKIYSPEHSLFYIPQKPYLCIGTLRDQLIYPDNYKQCINKGYSENDLLKLLEKVKLGYLVERQGGFDSIKEWKDVLSGGEKQRIAMSRVFYHKPKFAILDECTSAVSVDVESFMYEYCKQIGITLITISHRPSLWKHHEKKLYMDGRGDYTFGKMILPENYKNEYC
eukprot:384309_1